MRKLAISILILACAAGAHGEAVKSLRLILPAKLSPVVDNIGSVFARQVESRCEARLVHQDEQRTGPDDLAEFDDVPVVRVQD